MKAAIVDDFARAPRYGEIAEPVPGPDEVLVRMRGAALSQLVRSQAAGKHYHVPSLPFVPGADGVGLLASGERVYFAFPKPIGSMAERVVVKRSYCVPIPKELDDVTAAAIGNPGMSSWAALTERAHFQPGEAVLVNGAAGASGRLAVRIAKHLGARRVVASARRRELEHELRALGADAFVPLDVSPRDLKDAFAHELEQGIDVVLDYLWGAPAEAILQAGAKDYGGAAAPRVRFVQIGSLAGASVSLPANSLRSSGVELSGSGLGGLSNLALVRATGQMLEAVVPAKLKIAARAVPLADVAVAWNQPAGERLVFTT